MNFTHLKSGKTYTILDFGVMEATLEPMVLYRRVDLMPNGPIWIRPCKEFFDGRFMEEK